MMILKSIFANKNNWLKAVPGGEVKHAPKELGNKGAH